MNFPKTLLVGVGRSGTFIALDRLVQVSNQSPRNRHHKYITQMKRPQVLVYIYSFMFSILNVVGQSTCSVLYMRCASSVVLWCKMRCGSLIFQNIFIKVQSQYIFIHHCLQYVLENFFPFLLTPAAKGLTGGSLSTTCSGYSTMSTTTPVNKGSNVFFQHQPSNTNCANGNVTSAASWNGVQNSK